jgi:hypothetical protein
MGEPHLPGLCLPIQPEYWLWVWNPKCYVPLHFSFLSFTGPQGGSIRPRIDFLSRAIDVAVEIRCVQQRMATTTTQNPVVRLYVVVSLLLQNVWRYLHWGYVATLSRRRLIAADSDSSLFSQRDLLAATGSSGQTDGLRSGLLVTPCEVLMICLHGIRRVGLLDNESGSPYCGTIRRFELSNCPGVAL